MLFVVPSDQYPTLSDALEAARAGDTIELQSGASGAGTVGVNLTIVGGGGNGVTLTVSGASALNLQSGIAATLAGNTGLDTLFLSSSSIGLNGTLTSRKITATAGSQVSVTNLSMSGTADLQFQDIGSALNVSGGALSLTGANHHARFWGGAALNAGGAAVSIGGSSQMAFLGPSSGLPGQGSFANFGSLVMADTAILQVRGGSVATIAGDVLLDGGSMSISGTGVDDHHSTLRAANLSTGNETAQVSRCGDWTYSLTPGSFSIGPGGYVSVANTLTLTDDFLLVPATGSLEVGGDHGFTANVLRVGDAGTLTGHGFISAAEIVNTGLVVANHGRLTIAGDFANTSTGTTRIEDKSVLNLQGAFFGTVEFNGTNRTMLLLGSDRLYRPIAEGFEFTGSLKDLADGNVISLGAEPWDAMAAHTEFRGSNLLIRLSNNQTVTYRLDSPHAGSAVNLIDLPDGNLGLIYDLQNPKIRTGTSGTPAHNPYLDSLITGWASWNQAVGPITFFFGDRSSVRTAVDAHGEDILIQCDDPEVFNWTPAAKVAFASAMKAFASATGLTFQSTNSVADANLVFWAVPGENLRELDPDFSALSEIPSEVPGGNLWLRFDHELVNNADIVANGGVGLWLMIHEIGHALGLSHPHEGGSQPDANAFTPADATTGATDQDQQVYTAMSYKDGWSGEPSGTDLFGYQSGLGAFDIAALQRLYGANHASHTGNDTYALPTVRARGIGWASIWDAGGNDTIVNPSRAQAATIDLRAAPLAGPNAGGHISHINGIPGGFTIAAGVHIENARGGGAADTLIGNASANFLDGGAGADRLYGGLGRDTLVGGLGSDTYFIERADEIIQETTAALATGGNDLVIYSGIGTLRLATNVERLTLTHATAGAAAIGNGSANTLVGNVQVNVIDGAAGADSLNGGLGRDTLIGGLGDDTYFVERVDEIVRETTASLTSGGNDLVNYSGTGTFVLPANVERLALTHATANVNGAGNAAANTIIGNGKVNVLTGKAGSDLLTGKGGVDYFVFDTALGPSNVDRITDMTAFDFVRLKKAIFPAIGSSLTAGEFVCNTTGLATQADDRLIYETDTGRLSYDANGSAPGEVMLVAILPKALLLTHLDFQVIA